jgi:hypothetical protein
MANKREQRLRRKARAQARTANLELAKLRPVAIAAVRYIAEIDAPNLAEPYSIAHRRDELRDVVHASQGRPGRPRRDPQVLRAPVVVPVVPLPSPAPPPPAPKRAVRAPVTDAKLRQALARDVDLKRRDLEHAAQKFGAVANDKRHRVDWRPLSEDMQRAARALVVAERRLAEVALLDARRSA